MTYGDAWAITQELADVCNDAVTMDLFPDGYEWKPFESRAMYDGIYALGYVIGPGEPCYAADVQVSVQDWKANPGRLADIVRFQIEVAVMSVADRIANG